MNLFKNLNISPFKHLLLVTSVLGGSFHYANAEVKLESQVKIADNALHFDGGDIDRQNLSTQQLQEDSKYHFKFGASISAYGDAVKVYKNYVFMTWYRGGKDDRHVMLSRLNTNTGVVKTIEFPHRHTGFQGKWWIGESHNTIGLAVSPKNGTIHMVYDMHAYTNTSHGGVFKDDYFRYSYSVPGAAEVADEDFTLENVFVPDTSNVSQGPDDYKHLVMTRDIADKGNFAALTYPKFYETKEGDLIHYMRWGGNNNGAYYYNSYDADSDKWNKFVPFSHRNQKSHGLDHNWGLYGFMKYINGKLHVGFQKRSSDNTDKFVYQNGIYYAYLDDPANNVWRDHAGKQITWPLVDAEEIKVFEPGDLVETEGTSANGAGTPPGKVYIVGGFDFTLTDQGDLHFVHQVKDLENNVTIKAHTYKPAGATEFITETGFAGGKLYNAGNDLYIIGLDGGKPYVEKALGGTNNFERIYHADANPDGINFQRGVVNIKDGKAYYYMMEQATGTARPIYLQVIDLDLEGQANAPKVTFPESAKEVAEGYEKLSLGLKAEAIEGRTVESVALYIDGELVRVDDSDPYLFGHGSKPHETGAMGWTDAHSPNPNPFAPGVYTFRAVVTDSEGAKGYATMSLTVKSNGPTITLPYTEKTVDEGYEQLGVTVTPEPIDGRTIESVTLYINDELVRKDTNSPYNWGHKHQAHETGAMGWISCDQDPEPSPCHQPNPNPLTAGEHEFKFVAVDSEGDSSEAAFTLKVIGAPHPPIVTWPQSVYEVTEGYEKFSLSIPASSPVEGRTIKSVTLYRNGELVRKDTRAPWNWGHSFAPYEFGAMGWLDRHTPNPNPLGVGEHTFTAVAEDNTGLVGEHFAMTFIVKPIPGPTVSLEQFDGELEEGYKALTLMNTVDVTDANVGITSVELYVNGAFTREQFEAPYIWGGEFYESELLGLSAGRHEFKVIATDSNGKTGEDKLYITVNEAAMFGDLDKDGDVDRNDVRAFSSAVRTGGITDMRYDFNADGEINSRDVRGVALLCTRSGCATE
ncbi:BNR-4 repeat-containing protein [Paraglaciecola aquimarina]|uniref:BNR-4 repeat-containing protein n=1 Tax=Paraglaciecola algarum TaxID=3050085 RepID=A0ABS9D797_9ALTE|nr:BNR-4 repeat-containing protein [Paraglaciecola sp. G1-23]MCF2948843.1 BNR-4 repeat-containing protein [Paraglaciecola sp. G1-23]